MKGVKFFLFLICILFISFGSGLTGETISGESVSGEVVNQQFSLSISVELDLPSLEIIFPVSGEEYFSGNNFLFNISSSNYNAVWYNLDNLGNVTLKDLTFYKNLSSGGHSLWVYANNSKGVSGDFVSFDLDTNSFFVDYSNFSQEGVSSSTNFNYTSSSALENLEDVFFEVESYGKILFLEEINLTNDLFPSDDYVNLNDYVSISNNRIEINSTALPNLNKSARLFLYNLSFENPRILKDGLVCSDCGFVSYSGGNLEFIVNSFSVYSAEESPADEIQEGEYSGGSSRSSSEEEIDPELIFFGEDFFDLAVKEGTFVEKEILVRNNNPQNVGFEVSFRGDIYFLRIWNYSFSLDSSESYNYLVRFVGERNFNPGLYSGVIVFSYGGYEKEIPFVLNLKLDDPLFDVSLEIPEEKKEVYLGERVPFEMEFFNFGNEGMVDVFLKYELIDLDGNVYSTKEESVAVETRSGKSSFILIPYGLESGNYLISVTMSYGENSVAVSSDSFELIGEDFSLEVKIFILALLLFIVVVASLLYLSLRRDVLRRGLARISENDLAETK